MISEYFVYLPINFIKGIFSFFYIWYVQGSKDFWNKEIYFLEGVERDVGIIVHIRHMLDPLFGDYTYMGRFIGFFFRIGFILFGLLITSISILFVICLYLIWIIVPLITFWMIISNLNFVF